MIVGLVISCSKIGKKPAKMKYLQNICANAKTTNKIHAIIKVKQGIKWILKERQQVVGIFKGSAFAEACEEPPSPSPCEGDLGNPRLTVTTLGLPFRKEEG